MFVGPGRGGRPFSRCTWHATGSAVPSNRRSPKARAQPFCHPPSLALATISMQAPGSRLGWFARCCAVWAWTTSQWAASSPPTPSPASRGASTGTGCRECDANSQTPGPHYRSNSPQPKHAQPTIPPSQHAPWPHSPIPSQHRLDGGARHRKPLSPTPPSPRPAPHARHRYVPEDGDGEGHDVMAAAVAAHPRVRIVTGGAVCNLAALLQHHPEVRYHATLPGPVPSRAHRDCALHSPMLSRFAGHGLCSWQLPVVVPVAALEAASSHASGRSSRCQRCFRGSMPPLPPPTPDPFSCRPVWMCGWPRGALPGTAWCPRT